MIDGIIELDNHRGCKSCYREMNTCMIHDTNVPFTGCGWYKPHPDIAENGKPQEEDEEK